MSFLKVQRPCQAANHPVGDARGGSGTGNFRAAWRPLNALCWLAATLAAAPGASAEAPDPGESLRVFERVDGWIRSGAAPADPEAIDPEGVSGTSVRIRIRGAVLGDSTVMSDDGSSVWRATRNALREAVAGLPFESADERAEAFEQSAGRLVVEVELAGSLQPILGETFAAAARRIRPWVDGTAARVGQRVEAFFPGSMIATNADPEAALRACVGRFDVAPMELADLASRESLVVYRFETVHIVRSQSEGLAQFLQRGDRIIPDSDVTVANLQGAAESIARHLLTHEWRGAEPLGMTGAYLPHRDAYDPPIATPSEQALAAIALSRFARVPGCDGAIREESQRFAMRLLQRLTIVESGEPDPLADPLACALWLIARDDLNRSADAIQGMLSPEFATRARSTVAELFDIERGWQASAPRRQRALFTHCLAVLARDDPDLRDLADAALGERFRTVDAGRLVAEMPWLGWAAIELAGDAPSIGAAPRLRLLAEASWASQVTPERSASWAPDLAGGIVFGSGSASLPTWQTLRPLAFLGTALGDPRLVGAEEFAPELASMRRSLRFVLQLQVRAPFSALVRVPERSEGGIRLSTWDQTLRIEASALGLLTLSETLSSLESR